MPRAATLKIILRDILARGQYKIIESSPRGTFHLGNDASWKQKGGASQEEEKKKGQKRRDATEERRMDRLQKHYQKAIDRCPIQREMFNSHVVLNHAMCGLAFRKHYSMFLRQTNAGNCRYNWLYGWYHSRDASCVEFILGKGRYPWENDWEAKGNKTIDFFEEGEEGE